MRPFWLSADHATPGVERLVRRVREVDQTSPLNEQAMIGLAHRATYLDHIGLGTTELIGYAQIDHRDASVQLMIDPDHRRLGLGETLARWVDDEYHPRAWWAFGNLPAAQRLADKLGGVPIRSLAIMELFGPPTLRADLPAGYLLDHFRAGDLDGLVATNRAAFVSHPEQGRMDAADALSRMAEPWFDPRDLLVARDSAGRLVGFHWTKLDPDDPHDRGEVYVIGVHPDHEGVGLGSALLRAGIVQLYHRGARSIVLYVEADNQRVVDIYRHSGFTVTHRDVCYGRMKEGLSAS